MKLRDLTPNARALYWFLECRGPSATVAQIAEQSGIPLASIYEAAKRFPAVFELTGSLLQRSNDPGHESGSRTA